MTIRIPFTQELEHSVGHGNGARDDQFACDDGSDGMLQRPCFRGV
jgi:hypothetical protein